MLMSELLSEKALRARSSNVPNVSTPMRKRKRKRDETTTTLPPPKKIRKRERELLLHSETMKISAMRRMSWAEWHRVMNLTLHLQGVEYYQQKCEKSGGLPREVGGTIPQHVYCYEGAERSS